MVDAVRTATPAGPLQGVRVISMAELYPGPYATLLLGDLGAEIVLLERAQGGDPARQMLAFFAALNRGKKSVTVDLKDAAGSQQVRRLMRTADVFLEGFRPGVLERHGLAYRQVVRDAPHLIYVSITGFGQSGPYRDRPAHDVSYQALAGLLHDSLGRAQPAPPPAVPISDLSGGLFAVIGTLAALHRRHVTGRGCHIDLSMTDALVSMMTGQLVPLLNGKQIPDPAQSPGYGLFRCADDKDLTLSIVHENELWDRLCALIGATDLAEIGFIERLRRAPECRARIAAALRTAPRASWLAALERSGVPCGPVNELSEVIGDAHFRDRGMFIEVGDRPGGSEWHVRQPLCFDGLAPGPRSPAPALGANTCEILESTASE